MADHAGGGTTGQRWMSRWGVPAVTSLAVLLILGLVGVARWASTSLHSPPPAIAGQLGDAEDSGPTSAAVAEPSASPSPTPTATPSAPPAGGGQPASPPSTRPVITSFSASANGLIVTVTFTVQGRSDRGPFTCSVRRASVGTDEFPCDIGQVSRTYDYDFCCGSEIYVIATDRHGVRSEQWDGSVDFPYPDPPTYANLEGWHDGESGHVRFSVIAAPGDDPRCEIDISPLEAGIPYHNDDLPCEGTTTVALDGPPGPYLVSIRIRSDTQWNPPPPGPAQSVDVV